MGRVYEQFTLEERCEVARRREAGESIRKIAAALDRAPSSVSRELRRNTGRGPRADPYRPAHADDLAWARRWRGGKLERDEALQRLVLQRLSQGWSPEQIAGRLALERGAGVVSYETIYRFIYAQIRRTNDSRWRLYLPRAKFRRGRRYRRGGSPSLHIKGRVRIDDRPTAANDRIQAGHWEGDLMAFSAYGHNILAAHERTSRLLALKRQPTKQADAVAAALASWLGSLPPGLRRSITFDNGAEFASHQKLRDELGLATFFCDPHAPWQKGGVENAIGRMRKVLPRKTDLAKLEPTQLRALVRRYNNTPRRCLSFKTPSEVFSQLLHLECESTSRRSTG